VCFFFLHPSSPPISILFFSTPTPTTDIYTLSLHDALPIYHRTAPDTLGGANDRRRRSAREPPLSQAAGCDDGREEPVTRRSGARSEETRLNSSHVSISYAVFCLKKKKKK